jgi:hypothetical protein
VSDFGQNLALRHAMAAQAVRDDALRLVLQIGEQSLDEALGRSRVPPVLHQDVEHDPVLVNQAPEVEELAVDLQVPSSTCY